MDFGVENPAGSESQDAVPGAVVLLWDIIACPNPVLLATATPGELPLRKSPWREGMLHRPYRPGTRRLLMGILLKKKGRFSSSL